MVQRIGAALILAGYVVMHLVLVNGWSWGSATLGWFLVGHGSGYVCVTQALAEEARRLRTVGTA